MKFTKIPADAFEKLQLNAAVLLKEFTPATGTFSAADQIGATTGGINFTATPTYTDFGEDIDNCPKNVMEFKKLDIWEVKASGTFVTMDADVAKSLVGAADVGSGDQTKITPRNSVVAEDFKDLWIVGDYSDKNGAENGGFIAIHLMNVLSSGGFQMQTTDKAKGQFAFEYTAHYSLSEQGKVPFEIYIKAGTDET